MHMLCEQQQAIVEFQLQHARVSRSAEQNHFTTNFSTAMGKCQQAVLKLSCLGEKPHTAQALWRDMEQQTDWGVGVSEHQAGPGGVR